MNQIIATTMKALTLDQSQCFHSSGQIAEKPNVYGWSDQPQTLRLATPTVRSVAAPEQGRDNKSQSLR